MQIIIEIKHYVLYGGICWQSAHKRRAGKAGFRRKAKYLHEFQLGQEFDEIENKLHLWIQTLPQTPSTHGWVLEKHSSLPRVSEMRNKHRIAIQLYITQEYKPSVLLKRQFRKAQLAFHCFRVRKHASTTRANRAPNCVVFEHSYCAETCKKNLIEPWRQWK